MNPCLIHADPVWRTDTRPKRAEIERAVFYHCDQVGTPQALSNKVKAYFSSNGMKGLEVGVGTPGADFNFGYGIEAQGRTVE